MSDDKQSKPTKGSRKSRKKTDADTKPAGTERADGNPSTGEMVDLEALLAEIGARLITAGSMSLPQPQPVQAEPAESMQALVFMLLGDHYALELDHVGEVVRRPRITSVPGLPDWVLGVANLHGEIISVVDLVYFLDLGNQAARCPVDMLVTQAGDQRIGLMVDEVEIIYTFPTEQVLSPPFKVEPGLVAYLRGAVERQGAFIRLLHCERLLLGPQMQRFS